jgi:flagellar basal body-associated protein FliL
MSEPPPRKASFSRMTIVIAFLIAMVSAGCLVTFAFGADESVTACQANPSAATAALAALA